MFDLDGPVGVAGDREFFDPVLGERVEELDERGELAFVVVVLCDRVELVEDPVFAAFGAEPFGFVPLGAELVVDGADLVEVGDADLAGFGGLGDGVAAAEGCEEGAPPAVG